jgi:hypothetical protein
MNRPPIAKLPVWHPHPDEYWEEGEEPVVVTLASGTQVLLDDGVPVMQVGEPLGFCSICDGLGHGYPGGAPCPLEDRGWGDDDPRDAPTWGEVQGFRTSGEWGVSSSC